MDRPDTAMYVPRARLFIVIYCYVAGYIVLFIASRSLNLNNTKQNCFDEYMNIAILLA